MIRCLLMAGLLSVAGVQAASLKSPELPYTLPTRFEAGLIFVEPVTTAGARLRLFTDTGGGLMFSTAAADALGVDYTLPESGQAKGPVAQADWPQFEREAWIPKPAGVDQGVAVMQVPPHLQIEDGMLGAQWFANRCWEFDYPQQRLRLMPCGALPEGSPEHRLALHFQRDEAGEQTSAFPGITLEIDGEPLELLFDTGATITATEAALEQIADGQPATRAGSFIAASVAERWRQRHPDWPWIEKGERGTGMALVRVDNVRVAGFDTGPAWFAVRPDANFHEYMSQWMDPRVDGALGGSALQSFRIHLDYREAAATFER